MSELISGKEALIALANGEEVECRAYEKNWIRANNPHHPLRIFYDDSFEFRLKPRTITINGVEVPAPFEPKKGELFYYFSDEYTTGYASSDGSGFYGDMTLGMWRTEDEIKQVVEVLRKLFNSQ